MKRRPLPTPQPSGNANVQVLGRRFFQSFANSRPTATPPKDDDKDTVMQRWQKTVLDAIDIGNEKLLRMLFVQEELAVDANFRDGRGKTPLSHALEKDNPAMVSLLLEYCPPANQEQRRACLELAAAHRDLGLWKKLLGSDAAKGVTDESYKTAFGIAGKAPWQEGFEAVLATLRKKDVPLDLKMLSDCPKDMPWAGPALMQHADAMQQRILLRHDSAVDTTLPPLYQRRTKPSTRTLLERRTFCLGDLGASDGKHSIGGHAKKTQREVKQLYAGMAKHPDRTVSLIMAAAAFAAMDGLSYFAVGNDDIAPISPYINADYFGLYRPETHSLSFHTQNGRCQAQETWIHETIHALLDGRLPETQSCLPFKAGDTGTEKKYTAAIDQTRKNFRDFQNLYVKAVLNPTTLLEFLDGTKQRAAAHKILQAILFKDIEQYTPKEQAKEFIARTAATHLAMLSHPELRQETEAFIGPLLRFFEQTIVPKLETYVTSHRLFASTTLPPCLQDLEPLRPHIPSTQPSSQPVAAPTLKPQEKMLPQKGGDVKALAAAIAAPPSKPQGKALPGKVGNVKALAGRFADKPIMAATPLAAKEGFTRRIEQERTGKCSVVSLA